ncbi:MAG TPA: VCBS repeat-containing protein, partial [Planctomycetes bacterium]|nr:VCBS repeat-containing protein [Planctomycetota bacterium]
MQSLVSGHSAVPLQDCQQISTQDRSCGRVAIRGFLTFAVLCITVLLNAGCDLSGRGANEQAELQSPPKPAAKKTTHNVFTDVTETLGVSSIHAAGPPESFEFPRSMGSGCAWLDANGDRRLDILLVRGGATIAAQNSGIQAELYLQSENGRFINSSETAGLSGTGYGMGVAVGDIDNDGDLDVYLTKYGPDQLFLNDGTGHFTDATHETGIVNPQWSTAAAMVDVNQDGWLDLVVANYVDYFPGTFCADAAGREEFCGPQDFHGTFNRLFLNRSSIVDERLRFEDVSAASGIAAEPGKSLGLVCRDFDNDGDVDLFFANDGEPNQFWIQHEGIFENQAHVRGLAVNRFGEVEADMGTVVGNFCGDDHADLLVTHLSGEMNTLWQGSDDGYFVDQTSQFQFGAAGLAMTGFGVVA